MSINHEYIYNNNYLIHLIYISSLSHYVSPITFRFCNHVRPTLCERKDVNVKFKKSFQIKNVKTKIKHLKLKKIKN